MSFRLYLMCKRSDALVASQLPAEKFGQYMAVGTQKQTRGIVMFFEIDPEKIGGAISLEKAMKECVPHADGSPKRSKYLSIYRSMERIPLEAFGSFYLTTRDGRVLKLDEAPYDSSKETEGSNLYLELSPVNPLVVSRLGPAAFINDITNSRHAVSVPKLLLADLIIDREADGSLASYLPYSQPEHLINCLEEASDRQRNKVSKTVDRTPAINGLFRTINRGFFLGDQTGIKFYPYPSTDELDEKHHAWWRSASLG